jgi:hypothetical protein
LELDVDEEEGGDDLDMKKIQSIRVNKIGNSSSRNHLK